MFQPCPAPAARVLAGAATKRLALDVPDLWSQPHHGVLFRLATDKGGVHNVRGLRG